MPLFGSHLSVAGGLHLAPLAAKKYGFRAVQLFTKAPSQWAARPIDPAEADLFRKIIRETRIRPAVVHDSYLINLATTDETIWRKSVEALRDEVERADLIGAQYLVIHPGAHLGAGEEVGLALVARALDEVHERCPDAKVMMLLETTAGQGTSLGHRFEHLGKILELVAQPKRLGVCLDTCHVFAAGYPLAPKKEYLATMRDFNKWVGLKRLKVIHVNDSKKPLGSRVDRHEHIGRGCLGLEPFQLLVNDRRLRGVPMILETAKEVDPALGDMDAVNLATLQGLVA